MLRRSFVTLMALQVGVSGAQGVNNREVRPLDSQEVDWLAKVDRAGRMIVSCYANTSIVTPSALDTAFRNWKADASKERPKEPVVAQGLGVLFGNYVLNHKIASWMVVKDSFGTDLAVLSPTGGELYPISSVWKRISANDGDVNFFEPIWTLVAEKKFRDR